METGVPALAFVASLLMEMDGSLQVAGIVPTYACYQFPGCTTWRCHSLLLLVRSRNSEEFVFSSVVMSLPNRLFIAFRDITF